MFDVKKKLSSFIPSSARAQLQNVLTVEWDTHKTILVEVPGTTRSTDMEMSGMELGGRERSNYGRIADEDEENQGLFNTSNFNASRSRSEWDSHSEPTPTHLFTPPKSSKKRPPPLAPRPYEFQADENPFDESSPSYLVSSQAGNMQKQENDRYRQTTSVEQKRDKQANPWALDKDWTSQTSSPTSSRGTRESAVYDAEDPFR